MSESSIDYNGRRFRSVSNSAGGDVGDSTLFDYRQAGQIVWATYSGGGVRFGTLVAQVNENGTLDMRYQHVGIDGEFRTGRCDSTPERLDDGRLRLHETWYWTSGSEGSGQSIIEEIRPGDAPGLC